MTVAGYFLGNVPFVHQNLEKIILAILFVSMLPAFIAAGRATCSDAVPPRTTRTS